MDLVTDGRVLADSAVEVAAYRLPKERDRHPAVAVRGLICFGGGNRRWRLLDRRRRGVGADLGADAVELGVAERNTKKGSQLTDADDSPSTRTKVVGRPWRRTRTIAPRTEATRPMKVGERPRSSLIGAADHIEELRQAGKVAETKSTTA